MPDPQALATALSSGQEITDAQFDRIYPEAIQELSRRHFTPVAVARRAAALLAPARTTRVLDVGAGVGKFCLVGALGTKGTFVGVEQRGHLVDVATATTRRFGVARAHFVHANITDLDWSQFDAFYLFNPFDDGYACRSADEDGTPAEGSYGHYVRFTEERLAAARPGTRVVTYHGFGGTMPRGYQCALRELCGTDVVELWIKQPAAELPRPEQRSGMAFSEDEITAVGRRAGRLRPPPSPLLVLFVGAYDPTNDTLARALLLPEVQVVRVGTAALAQRMLRSRRVDGVVFGPDVTPLELVQLAGETSRPRLAAVRDDDPVRAATLTAQGVAVVAAAPPVLAAALAAALRLPLR